MTKKEKKVIIDNLLRNLYEATNADEAAKACEKIVIELFSSGFKAEQLHTIADAINLFITDIFQRTLDTLNKEKSKEFNSHFAEASIAILALLDLSVLPV